MQRAPRRSRAFWAEHADDFLSSGLGARAYCQEHGLNEGTFRSWLGRLGLSARRPESAPAELRILPVSSAAEETEVESDPPSRPAVEVSFDGLSLTIPAGTDPSWVGELFIELRAAC